MEGVRDFKRGEICIEVRDLERERTHQARMEKKKKKIIDGFVHLV